MSKTGSHVRSKRVGQVDKALWCCGNCRFFIPAIQAKISGRCTQGHGRKYGADGTDCPDRELKEPEGDLVPKEQI